MKPSAEFTRDNLPAEGWKQYQKIMTTPMVRIDGPFKVRTKEGPLECEDGFLAIDSQGWPYPIDAEVHAESYRMWDGPELGIFDEQDFR